MSGSNPTTVAMVANFILLFLFGGSAIWVFIDTRRRGRPLSESLSWALFMGLIFPLAVVVYIYFRRKKLL